MDFPNTFPNLDGFPKIGLDCWNIINSYKIDLEQMYDCKIPRDIKKMPESYFYKKEGKKWIHYPDMRKEFIVKGVGLVLMLKQYYNVDYKYVYFDYDDIHRFNVIVKHNNLETGVKSEITEKNFIKTLNEITRVLLFADLNGKIDKVKLRETDVGRDFTYNDINKDGVYTIDVHVSHPYHIFTYPQFNR